MDTTDFLEHHGVKGMKWGVRKKAPRRTSSDFKKTAHLRSRHPSELSNKQLKALKERVKLEENYHKMNPKKVAAGIAAVTTIIAAFEFSNRAFNAINGPARKNAISLGKKFLEAKAAGPAQTKAATSLVETLARNSGQIALQTVKK